MIPLWLAEERVVPKKLMAHPALTKPGRTVSPALCWAPGIEEEQSMPCRSSWVIVPRAATNPCRLYT